MEEKKHYLYAVKRGNSQLEFCPKLELAAPTIFVKETPDSEWEEVYSCHDNAIVEAILEHILQEYEVEVFEKDSVYFSEDEQLEAEDIDDDIKIEL